MMKSERVIKSKRIKPGSHIRVIAPVRSLKLLSDVIVRDATEKLRARGFEISFGKHVDEYDEFQSSSVESRIDDLHDAFSDKSVDAILTVIGGYNSNQLLQYIDYGLIEKNPKILCGFSDVTALANAINAQTGLITYIGPHFSSWAMKYGFEYSMEYFMKCCSEQDSYTLLSSNNWSDDPWYIDQERRNFIKNDGYKILNPGHAFGRVVGGHVRCLNVLQGTKFWPRLNDSILILEEDAEIDPRLFDRELQSLIHQTDFDGVRGILIGRFQKESKMTLEILTRIITSKQELKKIPIIANVDFGHTTPLATFPIGGSIEITAASPIEGEIRIIEH
jgi:muramoyltetrapeptide carboxypeptidase